MLFSSLVHHLVTLEITFYSISYIGRCNQYITNSGDCPIQRHLIRALIQYIASHCHHIIEDSQRSILQVLVSQVLQENRGVQQKGCHRLVDHSILKHGHHFTQHHDVRQQVHKESTLHRTEYVRKETEQNNQQSRWHFGDSTNQSLLQLTVVPSKNRRNWSVDGWGISSSLQVEALHSSPHQAQGRCTSLATLAAVLAEWCTYLEEVPELPSCRSMTMHYIYSLLVQPASNPRPRNHPHSSHTRSLISLVPASC